MKKLLLLAMSVVLVGCGDGGKETAADAKGAAEAKKSQLPEVVPEKPLPKTSAKAKKRRLPKAIPEKPLPPPKPEVRLAGMMVWGEKKMVFLDIRLPDWNGGWEGFRALEEGEMLNGVEVLSIDPEKGAVKLKIKRTFDTIKGQIVSDVVRDWPAIPKANPPKMGSVTLSFSTAPIDMVLDVFSDLSGRTIITAPHLPRGFLDLKPKGPMSEIGALEAIQALLTFNFIGIEPLGNKFVRVLPLAQLDAKRVPKNGGAFLLVNEPPVEEGKIVMRAGQEFMQDLPLDTVLDVFSDLSGRTIIAPVKLPRVNFSYKLQNDLSFNEAMELYQALLTNSGIGVVLHGDKSAFVLPASLLPHAPYYLGKMYANGEGHIKSRTEQVPLKSGSYEVRGEEWIRVEKDEKKAVKWFRKAAEQGHPSCQVSLALMYRDGKGVKQDYKKAIEWLTKAAEQGYPIAHRGLGYLHVVGWGVPKDNEKAYAWFTISVANGFADAKKSMSSVAKDMTPDQITKAEALAKEMVKKNPKLLKK